MPFIPFGKKAEQARAKLKRAKIKEQVMTALDAVKAGAGYRAVMNYYAMVKGQGDGVCHELATAIMQELILRNLADGWAWCRGDVSGGINHSWLEFENWCVDQGDDGNLRLRLKSERPFQIDDEARVSRRSPAETLAWVKEQESKTVL